MDLAGTDLFAHDRERQAFNDKYVIPAVESLLDKVRQGAPMTDNECEIAVALGLRPQSYQRTAALSSSK